MMCPSGFLWPHEARHWMSPKCNFSSISRLRGWLFKEEIKYGSEENGMKGTCTKKGPSLWVLIK